MLINNTKQLLTILMIAILTILNTLTILIKY